MTNAPSGGKGKKVTKKQASRFRYKWLKVIYGKMDDLEAKLRKLDFLLTMLDYKLSALENLIMAKRENVTIYSPTYVHDTAEIGEGTKIGAFCDIGRNVKIGKNCNIQCHVTISNGCKIGNNVFIGPNTSLLNDKYPISKRLSPVIIEDNAVIGGGVIILPNVKIGKGAVVGAGSVVTRDVPPNTVVCGNPARKICEWEEYANKKSKKKN